MGEIYKLRHLFPTFFSIPLITDEIGKGFIILFIRVSGKPQLILLLKNRTQLLDTVDWARNVHRVHVEKICVVFFVGSVFNGYQGPKACKICNKRYFISFVLFYFRLNPLPFIHLFFCCHLFFTTNHGDCFHELKVKSQSSSSIVILSTPYFYYRFYNQKTCSVGILHHNRWSNLRKFASVNAHCNGLISSSNAPILSILFC
jgi:hypothetical protein